MQRVGIGYRKPVEAEQVVEVDIDHFCERVIERLGVIEARQIEFERATVSIVEQFQKAMVERQESFESEMLDAAKEIGKSFERQTSELNEKAREIKAILQARFERTTGPIN
jgi:hypothetical protein